MQDLSNVCVGQTTMTSQRELYFNMSVYKDWYTSHFFRPFTTKTILFKFVIERTSTPNIDIEFHILHFIIIPVIDNFEAITIFSPSDFHFSPLSLWFQTMFFHSIFINFNTNCPLSFPRSACIGNRHYKWALNLDNWPCNMQEFTAASFSVYSHSEKYVCIKGIKNACWKVHVESNGVS